MLDLATKFRPNLDGFQLAAGSGFQHAELYTSKKILGSSDKVIARGKVFALGYAMHFPNRGKLTGALVERAADIYEQLGCSALVIHEPMFHIYGKQLNSLSSSMRVAVENHHQTRESWSDWANGYDWLTLDVEHCWKYTLQDCSLSKLLKFVRRFLKRHGDRLAHVHLPGYLPGCPEHRPQFCSHEMVREVFSLLAEFEFRGKVVSEVDPQFQNAEELRMDVLQFQRWLVQQGLNDLNTSERLLAATSAGLGVAAEPVESR